MQLLPGPAVDCVTATLWTPAYTDNYSHVQLRDLSASSRLHVAIGYNTLTFGYIDNTGTYSDELSVPMLLTSMDIKVVASGSSFDAYWKENGAAEWISVGHVDGGEGLGIDIADFDAVQLIGHGGYLGGVDTVRLAVISVPEPTTIMLCLTALSILFVLRRRS